MQVPSMFSGIFVTFCMGTSFQNHHLFSLSSALLILKLKTIQNLCNFFINQFFKQTNQHVLFATKTT